MNIDDKLEELFIDLPELAADVGHTLSAVQSGKLLYVAGAIPFSEGRVQFPGRVGVEVRADNAKMAARMAAICVLSAAKRELGNFKSIRRVVHVYGFVACGADFKDHAKVVDGASELFTQIFGPSGKHVRSLIGASSLPQNACVEISVVFEIK